MPTLEKATSVGGPVMGKILGEFKRQFLAVMTERASELEAIFMEAYDELAASEEGQFGSAIANKDPISLSRMRPLFQQQIRKELATNVVFAGNAVNINLMEAGPLGFSDDADHEGTPRSADILGFYVLGNIGEFGFITPAQYEARGRRSSNPLGRVGDGFLIPKDRYESERWAEVTGVPFSAVRHPISGQRPFNGFERAVKRASVKIQNEFVVDAVSRVEKALNPIVLKG